MTLRGRLTAAFLAVVLGPVVLGAFFVIGIVATVSQHRYAEQLNLAAATARTSIGALCQQLHAAADAVAVIAEPAGRAGTATQVVARGLAAEILITRGQAAVELVTPGAPPQPWADCARVQQADQPVRALAARVELRDERGVEVGTVTAAQPIDTALLARLAAATGTGVTLLDGDSLTGGGAHSTEPDATRDAVLAAAARVHGDGIAAADRGRYVRRVGPSPGQPLPLVLSVPREHSQRLYALLIVAVVGAGLLAVLVASRLARSTTRPLVELARAVDRVADGDLAARVPVRAQDEIGRLASTFNRMTRETQAYVQALTTSRDQLRRHLAVLGDTLSSTHDLHRILPLILQSALAATGARAGVVLLVDQATGTLVGHCAVGLDERWPVRTDPSGQPVDTDPGAESSGTDVDSGAEPSGTEAVSGAAGAAVSGELSRLRVPLGTGLLGTVAATGEPQRGRVAEDNSPLSADEPRCDTYVAVPFSVPAAGGDVIAGPLTRSILGPVAHPGAELSPRPGAEVLPRPGAEPLPRSGPGSGAVGGVPGLRPPIVALGVLALYDRVGADEFDDTDLVTLRTFAGHAAVAVDNVRVHEEAQRLSLTDPLTGLWNYRYLGESIRREVERASRFRRMLGALALDLDRFKEVNDTYGHAAGDAVLAEFARRIRGEIREVDLAFRRGGEEFVVLLPETDARGAATVAERLGAVVRNTPIVVEPHPGPPLASARAAIAITVSIGIAVYPDHATTALRVLDVADEALYAAKAAGRDTYRVAVADVHPQVREIPVPAGAASPEDGLPWAGERPPGRPGGASSGPHPPRQSRGR